MTVSFCYFDLGNVLVNFSHQRACEQMARVAEITPEQVHEVLFAGGLQMRYEMGQIDSRQFHERFRARSGSRPEYRALLDAASRIFEVNVSIRPVLSQLAAAGYPLGVLSNTCPAHWDFCWNQYAFLRELFSTRALSYEIKSCKPDRRIFEVAARLANVSPAGIFYVDDLAENVAAARDVGFDAVQYTSTDELFGDLSNRGIRTRE